VIKHVELPTWGMENEECHHERQISDAIVIQTTRHIEGFPSSTGAFEAPKIQQNAIANNQSNTKEHLALADINDLPS
jgi:hypothetical protein